MFVRSLKSFRWWLLCSSFLSTVGAHGAVLQISGGELTGALGVTVAGKLYNVEFVDGSCNSLFSGCSEASFAFHIGSDAALASQALLDQVFIDGPQGNFDSLAELTAGCSLGNNGVCFAITPYGLGGPGVLAVAAQNFGSDNLTFDFLASSNLSTTTDTTNSIVDVYARWTAVSEPASIYLLALGLAAFGFSRRSAEIGQGYARPAYRRGTRKVLAFSWGCRYHIFRTGRYRSVGMDS